MSFIDFYIVIIGFGLTILVQICLFLHYSGSFLFLPMPYHDVRAVVWFISWCVVWVCALFKRSCVGWFSLAIHQTCLTLYSCMSHSSCPPSSSQRSASDHQHQNTDVCDHAPVSHSNPVVGCGSDSKCHFSLDHYISVTCTFPLILCVLVGFWASDFLVVFPPDRGLS